MENIIKEKIQYLEMQKEEHIKHIKRLIDDMQIIIDTKQPDTIINYLEAYAGALKEHRIRLEKTKEAIEILKSLEVK
ncbi:MAG: hypothetical protein J6D47_18665 [Peptostreptococcaceae bacterium]|nr:hypothetical protein [Peptostreptococcaceae bacterium]